MSKTKETEKEITRETIQLERDEIRSRIAEVLEARSEALEKEAEKIAPDFDYEAEEKKLKAEEAAELAAVDFRWKETAKEDAAPDAPQKPLPDAVVSPSKYPGARREYRSAFARAMLGDRHRKTLTAALLLLCFFCAYQAWDYLVPKAVALSYTTYDGTETAEYKTKARTAAEVLDELKEAGSIEGSQIRVTSEDILSVAGELPVTNGLSIGILRGRKTTAMVGGKKMPILLVPGTVEETLALNEVSYDDDDEVKPAPYKSVDSDTKITVNEIHYDVKEKKEKVEAEDKVILDPSLTSGVQETTEGNDGEGVFTYTTKYINGKKKGTDRELREWITEPHDNTLRLGTSATGTEGEYIVERTFTANTTAYTAGAGARGAIGEVVHVGTCAVDPGYVSLRSELWVEGYGYAYANDTGGAVKGNVVDLYMSSRGQCVQWGRRNRIAYVIKPAE